MKFLGQYKYNGDLWALVIDADSWYDAEQRCKVLNLELKGEIKMQVPSWLPLAKPIIALYCTLRNKIVETNNIKLVSQATELIQ